MRCTEVCHGRGGAAPTVSRAATASRGKRTLLEIVHLIGVGLLVSACASSHAGYDGHSNVGGPLPAQTVFAVPPVFERQEAGYLEPSQPRVRKHGEPDDPSEPFSPNYGPAPATKEPAHQPQIRQLKAGQRQARRRAFEYYSRTTPMSQSEAQSIRIQAMIAHEQRNP